MKNLPTGERPTPSADADQNIGFAGLDADGRCPARTGDLLLVRQALYQLS
jgi:hypothetical protein